MYETEKRQEEEEEEEEEEEGEGKKERKKEKKHRTVCVRIHFIISKRTDIKELWSTNYR